MDREISPRKRLVANEIGALFLCHCTQSACEAACLTLDAPHGR